MMKYIIGLSLIAGAIMMAFGLITGPPTTSLLLMGWLVVASSLILGLKELGQYKGK